MRLIYVIDFCSQPILLLYLNDKYSPNEGIYSSQIIEKFLKRKPLTSRKTQNNNFSSKFKKTIYNYKHFLRKC